MSNETQLIDTMFDNLVKSKFIEMFGDLDSNSKHWVMKTIGEVAKVPLHYGSTASAIDYDDEVRYVRITDIGPDGKLNDDFKSPSTYDPSYLLNKGDVLFARSGSVGVTYYFDESYKSIFAGYLIRFIPDDKIINPEFAYQFTRSAYCQGILIGSKRGGVQKNVNAKQLSAIPIPLPPMELQNEFIEFIHQVDKSKVIFEREVAKYDDLIKSRFIEMFGNLNNNDKHWTMRHLKDLSYSIGDGLHGTPIYSDNGEYAFINGNNLRDGHIVIDNNTKMVDESQYNKYRVNLDDTSVLISINGTLGNIAFYGGEKIILGKSACFINLHLDVIHKLFFRELIQSAYFKEYLESEKTGTTINNVSLKSIRNFLVPVPPMSVQKQFTNFVEQVDKSKKIILNKAIAILAAEV